jgi:hypothetical protein
VDATQLESIVHGLARALDDARLRGAAPVAIALADVIPGRGLDAARVPKLAEAPSAGAQREPSADVEVLHRIVTEAAEGSPFAAEVARWCALEKTYETAEHAAFELSRMIHDAQARERILERRDRFMQGGSPPGMGPQTCLSVGPLVCLSVARAEDRRPEPAKPTRKVSALWTIAFTLFFIVLVGTIVHWLFD